MEEGAQGLGRSVAWCADFPPSAWGLGEVNRSHRTKICLASHSLSPDSGLLSLDENAEKPH